MALRKERKSSFRKKRKLSIKRYGEIPLRKERKEDGVKEGKKIALRTER